LDDVVLRFDLAANTDGLPGVTLLDSFEKDLGGGDDGDGEESNAGDEEVAPSGVRVTA